MVLQTGSTQSGTLKAGGAKRLRGGVIASFALVLASGAFALASSGAAFAAAWAEAPDRGLNLEPANGHPLQDKGDYDQHKGDRAYDNARAIMIFERRARITVSQNGLGAGRGRDPFSALVSQDRKAAAVPPRSSKRVERYAVAAGNRAFLFQTNGAEARVKFLCSDDDARVDCRLDPLRSAEEIYLLRATSGPRGDLIFKDRSGRMFLRLASYGGATVFWPEEQRGLAATRSYGDETSLRLPFADLETAQRRAAHATAYASAIAGAPILFEIEAPAIDGNAGAAVLADAISRAAAGLKIVASDDVGAHAIAGRLSVVKLIAASAPELSLDGRTLEVRYNPRADISGRPSSQAIARFLEGAL